MGKEKKEQVSLRKMKMLLDKEADKESVEEDYHNACKEASKLEGTSLEEQATFYNAKFIKKMFSLGKEDVVVDLAYEELELQRKLKGEKRLMGIGKRELKSLSKMKILLEKEADKESIEEDYMNAVREFIKLGNTSLIDQAHNYLTRFQKKCFSLGRRDVVIELLKDGLEFGRILMGEGRQKGETEH